MRIMRLALCAGFALMMLAAARPAMADTYHVNTTADAPDLTPGDGICAATGAAGGCTLRAAVQTANGHSGADTVDVPAGTYGLTVTGPTEDAAATGDLDLTSEVTVQGAGARSTIVNASGDRVFDARPGATVGLSGVTLTGGNVPGPGGGVRVDDANVGATAVTVDNNDSTGKGGGILVTGANGVLTLLQSTVSRNTAPSGGGIAVDPAVSTGTIATKLYLQNSTLSGNDVGAGSGGGLENEPNATSDVRFTTITNNRARVGSGLAALGPVSMLSTIVAGNPPNLDNPPPPSPPPECLDGGSGGFAFTSLGHNLTDQTNSDGCQYTATGDQISTDPQLSTLANNGGPTDTHSFPDTSSAKDAGADSGCLPTDQRGGARPKRLHCDVGAFELGALADFSVSLSDAPDPVSQGSEITYTITVTNNSTTDFGGTNAVDQLPPGTSFVSATGGDECAPPAGDGTVTCEFFPETGSSQSAFIVVRADSPGTKTDTVNLSHPTGPSLPTDPNSDNDHAATSTTVNPPAESSASPGSGTNVVNTPAQERHCIVPRLRGLKLRTARRRIAAAGCRVGRITRRHKRRMSGRVISQRPRAHTVRLLGARVALVVGKR